MLAEIAGADADLGVREEAAGRLVHARDPRAGRGRRRGRPSSACARRKHLASVAKGAALAGVREAALHALADPKALAGVVREAADPRTRLLALGRIEDGATLLGLAQNLEQKALAVAAVDRLSDPDALKAVAAKARVPAAARRARARLETGEPAVAPAVPRPVAAPAAATTKPSGAPTRRPAPRSSARPRRRASARPRHSARARGARRAARLDQALVARREALAALVAEAEALAGQELGCRAGRASASSSRAGARRRAGVELAELRRAVAGGRRGPALARRGASARSSPRRSARTWTRSQHSRAAPRPWSRAAPKRRCATPTTPCARSRRPSRTPGTSRPGASATSSSPGSRPRGASSTRCCSSCARTWSGSASPTCRCRRSSRRAPRRSWRSRTSSARRAVLHELDRRWKLAKEAPKDKGEALWTRFKAARDQVKAKVDAFLAKQAEEHAANLAKKQALCEKAEALAESSDWVKTAEALRVLQAEWKAIGPVPRAVSQRVWERFRKPCDRFFTRFQEHRGERSREWEQNLAKKEALCEKAEALAASTQWEEAAAGIKQLAGGVARDRPGQEEPRRGRVAALPRRLRPASSTATRTATRTRAKPPARRASGSARSSRRSPRRTARRRSRPTTSSRACRPRRRRGARRAACRRTSWKRSTQRFFGARDRLLELYPRAFQGSELDPDASRRRAEKLAARVEGLLESLAPRRRRARPRAPRDLAARLRDALASNTIGGREAVEQRWNAAASRDRDRAERVEAPRPAAGGRGPRARRALRARPAAASPDERPRPDPRRAEAPRPERPRRDATARGTRPRPSARGAEHGGESARPGGSLRALRAGAGPRRGAGRDPRDLPRRARARAVPAARRQGRRALAPDHPAPRAHARRARRARTRTRRSRRAPSCGRSAATSSRRCCRATCGGSTTWPARAGSGARSTSCSPRCSTGWRTSPGSSPSTRRDASSSPPRPSTSSATPTPRCRRTRGPGAAAGCACWWWSRGRAAASRSTPARRRATSARRSVRSWTRGGPRSRSLTRPTAAALQRRLAAGDVDVLHFVGHGHFDEAEREGFLVLEDERGGPRPLGAEALRQVVCQRGPEPRVPERVRDGARRAQRLEPRRGARARRRRRAGRGRQPVRGPGRGGDAVRARALLAARGGQARSATPRVRRASRSPAELGASRIDWAVPVVFARDPREPLR